MMCTVALGQVYFAVVGFPPVSVIPPLLHTHSPIIDAVWSKQLTASLDNKPRNREINKNEIGKEGRKEGRNGRNKEKRTGQ
jgi:hypothetical protein